MSRQIRYARWRKTLDQRADRMRRFRNANAFGGDARLRPTVFLHTSAANAGAPEVPESIWMMNIVWDDQDESTDAHPIELRPRRDASA